MEAKLEIVGRQTLFDKEIAIYGTVENLLFIAQGVGKWLGIKNTSQLINKMFNRYQSTAV